MTDIRAVTTRRAATKRNNGGDEKQHMVGWRENAVYKLNMLWLLSFNLC